MRDLLTDFVRSPSLAHLRSVYALDKLASEIVRRLDVPSGLWSKWVGSREDLVRAASPCWVPITDLAAALNALPGPKLTRADVAARIETLQDELGEWPRDDLRAACEAIFVEETQAGTELLAVIIRIRNFIEAEVARAEEEQARAYRDRVAAEKAQLEARFIAGADCKWTPISGSKTIFCRVNGRVFRLDSAADGRRELARVLSHDGGQGVVAGRYAQCADATAAVKEMAYKPDFL